MTGQEPESSPPGEEPLARAEALLERLQRTREELERVVEADDVDATIDVLSELQRLAKDVGEELARARREADADA